MWLADTEPEALHTLHLLRGVLSAVVASVVPAIVVLETERTSSPDRPGGALRRAVQRFRLRTKILVPMLFLATAPALAVGVFTILRARASLRENARDRAEFDTTSKARSIEGFCSAIGEDLVFLSRVEAVRDLADALVEGGPERIGLARQAAERELLVFSQGRRAYYQVRYIDVPGHEVVRLNVEGGLPRGVPFEQLQDKSDRYYVRSGMALGPGGLYVSPMDLNEELGRVEEPWRRVLRYSTPVEARDGRRAGLLVINLDATFLLSLALPIPVGTRAMLIEPDGTYLVRASSDPEVADGVIQTDLGDEQATSLLDAADPTPTVETDVEVLFRTPISYDPTDPARHMLLVVAHPRAPTEGSVRHQTVFLSVLLLMAIACACALGVLVAGYLTRPLDRLRQATRSLAKGVSASPLSIATGDELEELAEDFNAMSAALGEKEARLAAWNERLEGEVASQLDRLRTLQDGLARAEKMASIGQMTAGVVHEIGNPLAAMKTRIQVHRESEALEEPRCGPCHRMLDDVLGEVDRLAIFLRSFSRLGRTPAPVVEETTIPQVVLGVRSLVGPELRRRGLVLRMEAKGEVSPIQVDVGQLRQLLINLILNAADARPRSGAITIRHGPGEPGAVEIEVADDGVGIESNVLERIGDTFFTTKEEGTGLGLAICQRIAEDHGGAIRLESRPGEGTTVFVRLRAAPVTESCA